VPVASVSGVPRIWLHAASVGEVKVAGAIIESINSQLPKCEIIVSTTTMAGHELSIKSFNGNVTFVYAPVDFIISVRKSLSAFKPDILVCIETEIWPNWLVQAHKMGIRTIIVNGRISVRSIKKYLKIKHLMKYTLSCIDAFSMIENEDAERIGKIGAPLERVEVNGNAKYDLLARQTIPEINKKMEAFFNLKGGETVFVAGSTRKGEEKIILETYMEILKDFPDTILVIAPRHIERTQQVEIIVREYGCQFQLFTELKVTERKSPVVIVNTIGELQALYSIATIVFCGGSLVPLGGQNILEAAVWGKPVLFGPYMDDFIGAKDLLEQVKGGIQVENGHDLTKKVRYYLLNKKEAESVGNSGRKAVMSNKGAADKHTAVICRYL
jgi:3-deoxy-D-manno-octulosonic-acid transferase